MRYAVLSEGMVLCDAQYCARVRCYAMRSTERGYGAMRCAVLSRGMVLPGMTIRHIRDVTIGPVGSHVVLK
eukprot:777821-Rhodomonas_salina.1